MLFSAFVGINEYNKHIKVRQIINHETSLGCTLRVLLLFDYLRTNLLYIASKLNFAFTYSRNA